MTVEWLTVYMPSGNPDYVPYTARCTERKKKKDKLCDDDGLFNFHRFFLNFKSLSALIHAQYILETPTLDAIVNQDLVFFGKKIEKLLDLN